MTEQIHRPTNIQLHTRSRELELEYADGQSFHLGCEYLRVYSPSAEVLGHGPGEEVLQVGKMNVGIKAIKPVGNYAIQLEFDDGHDSGIYSWDYLYRLGTEMQQRWQNYLDRMEAEGANRDPDVQIIKLGL